MQSVSKPLSIVILAAGQGKRMKSDLPKVLQPLAGRPLLQHVIDTAKSLGPEAIHVVYGHGGDRVREAMRAEDLNWSLQAEQLGTGHAVMQAVPQIPDDHTVLILYGDVPLLRKQTLTELLGQTGPKAIAVLTVQLADPFGYGRIVRGADGNVARIVEQKDATRDEQKLREGNTGVIAAPAGRLKHWLAALRNDNAQGEYYLTDIVEIASGQGLDVVATEASFENALGINNRAELAQAEGIWQARRRQEAMLSGVTLIAPETVYFSHDTEIGADTIVEPNVWFGPGVKIAGGAKIHAFSHIEGATIASNCDVGPFARLRPGADLRTKAKVGNFCEVKQAVIEEGAKVNHLTYIGDARVGAGANIGAGTITCNYDGYSKFFTDIGEGAFIGSNSSLVAPVTIGRRGYIASGSVITESVPDDALAFGRARQKTIPGKGKELRERFASAAAAKKKAGADH